MQKDGSPEAVGKIIASRLAVFNDIFERARARVVATARLFVNENGTTPCVTEVHRHGMTAGFYAISAWNERIIRIHGQSAG